MRPFTSQGVYRTSVCVYPLGVVKSLRRCNGIQASDGKIVALVKVLVTKSVFKVDCGYFGMRCCLCVSILFNRYLYRGDCIECWSAPSGT